jgi:serine/threonine-protein kinase RsbW
MLKKTSKLIVPNDSGYIKGAISYCNEISRRVGFSKKETREIGMALNEACTNVVTHAFDPYEDESFTITFEILSDGIKKRGKAPASMLSRRTWTRSFS